MQINRKVLYQQILDRLWDVELDLIKNGHKEASWKVDKTRVRLSNIFAGLGFDYERKEMPTNA